MSDSKKVLFLNFSTPKHLQILIWLLQLLTAYWLNRYTQNASTVLNRYASFY